MPKGKQKKKKPAPSQGLDPDTGARELVKGLQASRRQPVGLKRLLGSLSEQERWRWLQVLEQLQQARVVRPCRREKWQLLPGRRLFAGRLQQGQGTELLLSHQGLKIPKAQSRNALAGDLVLVTTSARRHQPRRTQVVAVVERSAQQLVAWLTKGRRGQWEVRPDGQPIAPLRLAAGAQLPRQAAAGDLVLVQTAAGAEDVAEATLQRWFGPAQQTPALTEAIAYRYELPMAFSQASMAQAQGFSRPATAEDWQQKRRDVRQLPLVTIDGADAKDFDDAVWLETRGSGYRLFVAIADVAAYVTPDSPLDHEARKRGTSVYFPGTCIPMLPETLSNDLCSLKPGEERLVWVVELGLDSDGAVTDEQVYPGVMASHGRFTYDQVSRLLEGDPEPEQGQWQETFVRMRYMAQRLYQRRLQRGALDLELPVAVVELAEDGQPQRLSRQQRTWAHRLIEEFMLLANETVAKRLRQLPWPCVYRVHEPPSLEALERLQQELAGFGLELPTADSGLETPVEMQQLVEQLAGRREQALVQQMLLRSLAQAHYSATPEGHFALALADYCHFTSPIRRYPDLLVHRLLWLQFRQDTAASEALAAQLPELAAASSRLERRVMDAERDVLEVRKCQYMQQHVGEVWTGWIFSVVGFGFFVRLQGELVEGLVHVRQLRDDYYDVDLETQTVQGRRHGRCLQIGDRLKVRLAAVDPVTRRIDLELQEQLEEPRT